MFLLARLVEAGVVAAPDGMWDLLRVAATERGHRDLAAVLAFVLVRKAALSTDAMFLRLCL
jgi:hypothetical protein